MAQFHYARCHPAWGQRRHAAGQQHPQATHTQQALQHIAQPARIGVDDIFAIVQQQEQASRFDLLDQGLDAIGLQAKRLGNRRAHAIGLRDAAQPHKGEAVGAIAAWAYIFGGLNRQGGLADASRAEQHGQALIKRALHCLLHVLVAADKNLAGRPLAILHGQVAQVPRLAGGGVGEGRGAVLGPLRQQQKFIALGGLHPPLGEGGVGLHRRLPTGKGLPHGLSAEQGAVEGAGTDHGGDVQHSGVGADGHHMWHPSVGQGLAQIAAVAGRDKGQLRGLGGYAQQGV